VESCKRKLRQRLKPTKRNDEKAAYAKGKTLHILYHQAFCCVLHIPPHENGTINETGGLTTDVNSESPIYEEQWFNSKQNLRSYS